MAWSQQLYKEMFILNSASNYSEKMSQDNLKSNSL